MGWQLTPVALVYFGAAFMSIAVAAVARRRRTVPGAQALFGLLLGVTIWTLSDGLESALSDLPAKIFVAKLSYLGIQTVPVLFLLFVLGYTHREHWLTPRRVAALWLLPAVTLLLVFTNEWHHLIWANIESVKLITGPKLYFTHGPAFWVAATYHYCLILLSTLLLLRTLVREHDLYRQQAAVLVVATAVPWIANIVYLSNFNPLPALDWTPLAFAVTGALVAYAVFILRLLDLVPVAHNALIERMSDAVLVTDTQDRVVDANPAAHRLFGAAKGLIGQPIVTLLDEETVAQLVGSDQEIHTVIHLQNHALHGMDTLCTPLHDRKGRLNGRLIVLRDISERLHMEEELRRSEEHYRSFLAMMSHELRTPLTGILGMTEAMQEHVYGPLTERQVRSLRIIEQSGRHLAGVINDMLDLSRIQSGTLELRYGVCTLGDLCAAGVATVADEAERKQQKITVQVDQPDQPISVDVRRFEQVLSKLLSNAVKFTPEGGELGLTATLQPEGNNIAFQVWDRGIGIEPAAVAQLFQPFTQADERLSRAYGGAGLGLALVRRLVDMHGGVVEVDSAPGQGSSFTVLLPVTEMNP
jgi:PAS domain S-box-containing protein